MYIAEIFYGAPEQTPKDTHSAMVAEADQKRLVVLYPGRFQPFHLGHADVFRTLQNKFGRDNVFIATSNKTDGQKSPFNFTDKTILMGAAGVPADRVLEVASPYKLPEQFPPEQTVFIAAVGLPDLARLSPDKPKKDGTPGYFLTFKSLQECETADKHGYVVVADERHFAITLNGQKVDVSHGTPSRAAWNSVRNDAKGRGEYMTQMFGRNDPELGRVLDKIPTTTVAEESRIFKVGDFKLNVFESFDQFRRSTTRVINGVGPQSGGTRLHPLHYMANFVSDKIITEAKLGNAKKEAELIASTLKEFDQRDEIVIKVGAEFAVLSTLTNIDRKIIEIEGTKSPQKIAKIHLDINDKIDRLEFDNGEVFPSHAELTVIANRSMSTTIFLKTAEDLNEAYTKVWFVASQLENKGWQLHSYLSEAKQSLAVRMQKAGIYGKTKASQLRTPGSIPQTSQTKTTPNAGSGKEEKLEKLKEMRRQVLALKESRQGKRR